MSKRTIYLVTRVFKNELRYVQCTLSGTPRYTGNPTKAMRLLTYNAAHNIVDRLGRKVHAVTILD